MKRYFFALVGTLLFAVFIWRLDFREIGNSLSSVSIGYPLLVLLLNIPVLFLKAFRWKLLLSKYGLSYDFSDLFGSISAGFFLGLVTPGTVGELGRSLTMDLDKSRGMGTVVYEKLFDFSTLFFLSLGSLLIYYLNLTESLVILGAVCLVFSGSMYVLLKKGSSFFSIFLRWIPQLRAENKLDHLYNVFSVLFKDFGLILISAFVSLILWAIAGAQFYFILKALDIVPSIQMVSLCFFLSYLAGVFSLIPLGLGVLDFSMVGLMGGLFGVASTLAYTSAVTFRLLVTVPLVIWGYSYYIYKIMRKRQSKAKGLIQKQSGV